MIEKDLIDIKEKLKNHEERLNQLESLFDKDQTQISKELSLREFIMSKNPNNDVKKTLTICYYLEMYKGMNMFNKEDIEEGFRRAKEKIPDNINYKVIRNIEKGYLMEGKDKKNNLKAWTLTNSGIEYVKNSFKINKNSK